MKKTLFAVLAVASVCGLGIVAPAAASPFTPSNQAISEDVVPVRMHRDGGHGMGRHGMNRGMRHGRGHMMRHRGTGHRMRHHM